MLWRGDIRLGAGRVFREVAELIKDRDWTILASEAAEGEAPIDDEGSALIAQPRVDRNGMPLRIPLPTFRPTRKGSQTSILPQEIQDVSPIGRASEDVRR